MNKQFTRIPRRGRLSSLSMAPVKLRCHQAWHLGTKGIAPTISHRRFSTAPDPEAQALYKEALQHLNPTDNSFVPDIPKAISNLEKAIAKNHIQSMKLLGSVYFTGRPELKEDFLRSRQLIEQAAAFGDAEALCALAPFYLHGLGGAPLDAKKAREYYTKAAELEYPAAVNSLANCYIEGIGGPKDMRKGLELYLEASFLGDRDASLALVPYYLNGVPEESTDGKPLSDPWIMEPSNEEAVRYAELALSQGNAEAASLLGLFYSMGAVVPRDNKKALDYYLQAANHGFAAASYAAGKMIMSGDEAAGIIKDEERGLELIKKAAQKGDLPALGEMANISFTQGDWNSAREWAQKGGARGDTKALMVLANLYLRGGGGIPEEPKTAFVILCKAAGLDPSDKTPGELYPSKPFSPEVLDAIVSVANLYRIGLGTEPNKERGEQLLRLAARRGHTLANFLIGELDWAKGEYHSAATCFESACSGGYAPALFNLGKVFETGQGRPSNAKTAAELYEKLLSVDDTHAEANFRAGTLYLFGDKESGLDVNEEKGVKYLKRSAELGSINAKVLLVKHTRDKAK